MSLRSAAVLAALALASACTPPETFTEDPVAMTEQPVDGVPCAPGASAIAAECSGGGVAWPSVLRVGATAESRGSVAQVFTSGHAGRAGALSLGLRLLRPGLTGTIQLSLHRVLGEAPLSLGPAIASASTSIASLPRNAPSTLALTAGAEAGYVQAGARYAFVLETNVPETGTVLVGVASHQADVAGQATWSKTSRGATSRGWVPARAFDVSFRLDLGACASGYEPGATGCVDVDECAGNPCDPLTTCTNADGSFTCSACPTGYTGNGVDGCTNVNECATGNGDCDPLTTCTDTEGSRTCSDCPAGYTGNGATGCTNVNECATNNGGCDPLTTCTDTEGSRTCGACPAGYLGTGETGCTQDASLASPLHWFDASNAASVVQSGTVTTWTDIGSSPTKWNLTKVAGTGTITAGNDGKQFVRLTNAALGNWTAQGTLAGQPKAMIAVVYELMVAPSGLNTTPFFDATQLGGLQCHQDRMYYYSPLTDGSITYTYFSGCFTGRKAVMNYFDGPAGIRRAYHGTSFQNVAPANLAGALNTTYGTDANIQVNGFGSYYGAGGSGLLSDYKVREIRVYTGAPVTPANAAQLLTDLKTKWTAN